MHDLIENGRQQKGDMISPRELKISYMIKEIALFFQLKGNSYIHRDTQKERIQRNTGNNLERVI